MQLLRCSPFWSISRQPFAAVLPFAVYVRAVHWRLQYTGAVRLRDRDLYLYTAPGAESDVYDCFVVQCDGTCVKTPPDLFGDSPTERRRRNDGRQASAYLPLCQPDSSSNHVRRHSGCRTTAMPDYLEKLYSARLAGDKYRAAQPVCSVSPLSLPRHSSLGM